ncbi:MAG: pilus assembly protein TadG-related protein [Propionibacteriaceae bacterium]
MRRNEAGQSLSIFTVLSIVALILIAGIATDGGAKIVATRQAQAAAYAAARSAADAGATSRIAGRVDPAAAMKAGQHTLDVHGVSGTVVVQRDGSVVVTTKVSKPTMFLSLVGLPEVSATGSAVSVLSAQTR